MVTQAFVEDSPRGRASDHVNYRYGTLPGMTAERQLRPRQLELLKAAAELWDQDEPEGLNYLARLWLSLIHI